jgi:hypothetical protein
VLTTPTEPTSSTTATSSPTAHQPTVTEAEQLTNDGSLAVRSQYDPYSKERPIAPISERKKGRPVGKTTRILNEDAIAACRILHEQHNWGWAKLGSAFSVDKQNIRRKLLPEAAQKQRAYAQRSSQRPYRHKYLHLREQAHKEAKRLGLHPDVILKRWCVTDYDTFAAFMAQGEKK